MTIQIQNHDTRYKDALAEIASEANSSFADQINDATLYRSVVKRLLDIALVLCSAPIIVPVVIILAALIAFRGGSPLYSQLRVGMHGKVFRMWKFRTMVTNSEEILEAQLITNPELRAEWEEKQKLRNDPRITPFGQFLRKSSLDELPQLWNVLLGTMSLVGPRPLMPSQMPQYVGQSYFRLRPGITGNWQISDRNNSLFADRAKFDESYAKNHDLLVDLRILAQTVLVVLRGTGL